MELVRKKLNDKINAGIPVSELMDLSNEFNDLLNKFYEEQDNGYNFFQIVY